jgi:hypothetical protein
MDQPIGPLLDSLAVTIDLDHNEHLTEALVISKISNFDNGETRLSLASNGIDWISKIGLVHAACTVVDSGIERVDDEP